MEVRTPVCLKAQRIQRNAAGRSLRIGLTPRTSRSEAAHFVTAVRCLTGQINSFRFLPSAQDFSPSAVSELNEAKNPVRSFVFRNPDGSRSTIQSPDPGRALITGKVQDANMFKISPLRGIRRTAPYFHDNSARTLEEVAAHYSRFFQIIDPNLALTGQDQADIVAYLKLLD